MDTGGIVDPRATTGGQKGWSFLQKSGQSGTWHVYMTESALMSKNDAMHVTVVTKAPTWPLAVYNSKTKIYYLSTVKDWHRQNPKFKRLSKTESRQSPLKGEQGIIGGLRATQYFVTAPVNGGVRQAEVWIANDVHISPELSLLFERMYGSSLGSLHLFPLRFSYIDESGKKTIVMDTVEGRQELLNLASFNTPTHYKRVDNEMAVYLDNKDQKIMATVLDDLEDPESQKELNALLGSSGNKRPRRWQH